MTIAFLVPMKLHQALKVLVYALEKLIVHVHVFCNSLISGDSETAALPAVRTLYVFTRKSSFGQTQYIPPGIPADLITRVATIGVLHCGHGLPASMVSLSLPILARAVLLIFAPEAIES